MIVYKIVRSIEMSNTRGQRFKVRTGKFKGDIQGMFSCMEKNRCQGNVLLRKVVDADNQQ